MDFSRACLPAARYNRTMRPRTRLGSGNPAMKFRFFTAIFGFLLSGCFSCERSAAAEPARPPIVWKLNQDFATTLQSPGSGTWKRMPLKLVIADLSRIHRIFLLLDRRVDLDQQLEYTAPNGSLEVTLRGIADHLKLGIAIGNGWVYLGPPDAAKKIRTLCALREVAAETELPKELRTQWQRRSVLVWQNPKPPRELAESLVEKLGKITNPEAIVHDLWEPRHWPTMPAIEQLSLLLVQFDLTWTWEEEGQKLKLVPLPQEVVVTKQYTVADPEQFAAKLKSFNLAAKIESSERVFKITGTAEDQQIAADLAAGKQARKVVVNAKPDSKRYTLQVKLPVQKLLQALAPKLELQVEFDEAAIQKANLSLDREIQLDVNQVTQDELLTKVVDPAGMKFEIKDKKLLISPK